MITKIFLDFIVLILGGAFSWLPTVTKLPTLLGLDLDATLITGMGQFNLFRTSFWPFDYLFITFMALMGYYTIKMLAKSIFGARIG